MLAQSGQPWAEQHPPERLGRPPRAARRGMAGLVPVQADAAQAVPGQDAAGRLADRLALGLGLLLGDGRDGAPGAVGVLDAAPAAFPERSLAARVAAAVLRLLQMCALAALAD